MRSKEGGGRIDGDIVYIQIGALHILTTVTLDLATF